MKCIVFDVDDTLYKRSQPFTRAARDIFGNRFDWDWNELYRIRNIYSEEIFADSQAGRISMEEMYEYRLGKAVQHFGYTTNREEVLQFEKKYIYYQSLIQLDPPFDTLIEKLYKMNVPMAVLTNGPSEHQRNKIRALHLEQWIPKDRWIVSGDYAKAKPAPEIFHATEEKLSLKPEDLIIIGDNYQSDILGAINVGWKTIWYNHIRLDSTGFPAKPDYECQSMDDVVSTLLAVADMIIK